jgi:subtilisin family serine protease
MRQRPTTTRIAKSLSAVAAILTVLVSTASPAVAADPVRDAQWHLGFLHVEEAQRITLGEGVTVGVIDTGVDAGHPDLVGSVLPGHVVPPLLGDPDTDPIGHGTAMAGLIAAHGRALGIAPEARILPVTNTQALSGGAFEGGVRWAVDHGATVLCLAYGREDDPTARADIAYAISKDVVVVAGIGNTNVPLEPFPAAYPGVVSAAGVDRNGDHSAISVVAPYATLAAPSDDIVSTDSRSDGTQTGYLKGTGTSNSTAIIAGAAALVRAKFPTLSAAEVIHRLTATADDKGPPGRDDQYGFGIVNLVKALTADVPPLTPSATPTQVVPLKPVNTSRTLVIVVAFVIAAAVGASVAAIGVIRARRR